MPNRLAAFDEGKYEDAPEVAASVSAWAERNLWLAVLERAIRDAKGDVETTVDARVGYWQLDAIRWLASESREPGSFKWVLSVADVKMDAGWVRKAVLGRQR